MRSVKTLLITWQTVIYYEHRVFKRLFCGVSAIAIVCGPPSASEGNAFRASCGRCISSFSCCCFDGWIKRYLKWFFSEINMQRRVLWCHGLPLLSISFLLSNRFVFKAAHGSFYIFSVSPFLSNLHAYKINLNVKFLAHQKNQLIIRKFVETANICIIVKSLTRQWFGSLSSYAWHLLGWFKKFARRISWLLTQARMETH